MSGAASTPPPATFFDEIAVLRRDDHRLYHQSRINQTLHLISALVFLVCYALVWFRPADAAILGWFGAMWVRQSGHFFFEPLGYDEVNKLTNAKKEDIKVGFNVYRKVALLLVWASVPVILYVDSTMFGLFDAAVGMRDTLDRIGWSWLTIALGGLALRTAYLMAFRSVRTGAAWFSKILLDPFHNVHIYWRSPIFLLQGQLIEPLEQVEWYRQKA